MDEKAKEWLKKNKEWLKKQGKVYDEKTGTIMIDESGFFNDGKSKTTPKQAKKKK